MADGYAGPPCLSQRPAKVPSPPACRSGVHRCLPNFGHSRALAGLVLREEADAGRRRLVAQYSFKEFTYWNLESVPAETDTVLQACAWPALAAEVGRPPCCTAHGLPSGRLSIGTALRRRSTGP